MRSWVMNHLSNVHPPQIHPQFVYRLPFLSWLKRLLEMILEALCRKVLVDRKAKHDCVKLLKWFSLVNS